MAIKMLDLVLILLEIYVAYWVLSAIYNLYLHPLAGYRGSKLAAVSTEWYEWYWNIYHRGQLLFEIERLHRRHGPVIRIGVNELHVNDPEFFQEMTKTGSKFVKEPNFYRGISFPNSSIGMVDASQHRIRRQVLSPAFSSSRVHQIAPNVDRKIRRLCHRFDDFARSKTPVSIHAAFKSLTMDIISEMIFGQEFGVIDSPAFRHPHLDVLQDAIEKAWIFRTFPTLSGISLALPEVLSQTLFPVPIIEFSKKMQARVNEYVQERDLKKGSVDRDGSAEREQQKTWSSRKEVSVVLEQLLDPHAARGHLVPNSNLLNEEALTLLTAGNDTTANSMILGAYYVCRLPDVQRKLVDELYAAFPSSDEEITYARLKDMPYITAVIKEILRISNPLPGRLPRIVPSEGCTVKGQFVKSGTIIHTSAYLLNRHSSVWGEDAMEFDPSRWLHASSSELDKYMTSFYRGSRQCLGMNLAWCELYLLFGHFFRRYKVSIHETTDEDMTWTDHLLMLFKNEFHVTLDVNE